MINIKKNKKLIKQNKRNFLINRYYKTKIKNIVKSAIIFIKKDGLNETIKNTFISNFYSIIDKAIKKNVIHKNTAARKKHNFAKKLLSIKNYE
jgi:small subunit ribosomal protein S20